MVNKAWRWFYTRVVKGIPPVPYVPKLSGLRPLENGRLVLSYFNNKKEYNEEVRIFNLWKYFENRRDEHPLSLWYNPEFFKKVYVYHGCACWDGVSMLALGSDWLYENSALIQEGFECVV